MKREFFNLDHANNYLHGSIIRLGDEPIMVVDVSNSRNFTLTYYYLKDIGDYNMEMKRIPLKDEDINMSPVSLGYCWTDNPNITGYDSNMTVYIHRVPARAWKVGLYQRNVEIVKALGRGGDHQKHLWVPSKMLRDTIRNKYPALDEAMAIVKNKQGIVPFSRRFAVNGNVLVYKTFLEPVGVINDRTYETELFDQFMFLKEVLQEDKQ